MEENKTFKELNEKTKIVKKIKKHGMSLGLTFSKEEQERFKLNYEDDIDLSNAKIIKKNT